MQLWYFWAFITQASSLHWLFSSISGQVRSTNSYPTNSYPVVKSCRYHIHHSSMHIRHPLFEIFIAPEPVLAPTLLDHVLLPSPYVASAWDSHIDQCIHNWYERLFLCVLFRVNQTNFFKSPSVTEQYFNIDGFRLCRMDEREFGTYGPLIIPINVWGQIGQIWGILVPEVGGGTDKIVRPVFGRIGVISDKKAQT